jgi:hypothetical protein
MLHLDQDLLRCIEIRTTMADALKTARNIAVRSHVSERVAVAFISPGRLLN